MAKAKIVKDSHGFFHGVQIVCRGCRWPDGEYLTHTLETDWVPPGMVRSPFHRKDGFWSFNGDLDNPVFGPSLRCESGRAGKTPNHICHSFIGCNGALPGQIIYLSDSTHDLAGQTVDLPEVP